MEKLESLQNSPLNTFTKKAFKKLTGLMVKFGSTAIVYSFLVWLFLSIYDRLGFEKTLIILAVGVIHYGIRR